MIAIGLTFLLLPKINTSLSLRGNRIYKLMSHTNLYSGRNISEGCKHEVLKNSEISKLITWIVNSLKKKHLKKKGNILGMSGSSFLCADCPKFTGI